MVDVGTYIIEHRNYFTFPESFSPDLNPTGIYRLIFKGSGHGRIIIEGDQWQHLQTILIQGCHFVDLQINIPEGDLREIIVGGSKYVTFLAFRGTFSKLEQWGFDHCKYLSLKGPFIGKMALNRISVMHCPQFKLFENPGLLPFLEEIEVKQSHHGKIDFSVNEMPRLRKVTLEECNVVKIKNLGNICATIANFFITRCSKIWMDDDALNQLRNFPGFKYTPIKPEREAFAQLMRFSGPTSNNAELEAELEAEFATLDQDYPDVLSAEENNNIEGNLDIKEDAEIKKKFCPECGHRVLILARFCDVG